MSNSATPRDVNAAHEERETGASQWPVMAATRAERQRASDAERSRLATILANLDDAVLIVNEHGETVLANAALKRLFGVTGDIAPENERGHPLPEEAWPRRRAAQGETFTMPFTITAADGTRRAFETNAQPIQGIDDERWSILVIRDITDRHLLRQQDEFLAVAAHELRTPLTVLSGRIQLLSRRLVAANANERLLEHADRALEQVHHLEADIDELMDAARLQFGRIVLNRAPIDLLTVIRQATDAAAALATGQAISVDAPEHPVMVDGDGRRLERVLLNVLVNAITYAPESERIDVRLRTDAETATVEIEDRGPGIAAEDLPHIFSRFARLETSPRNRQRSRRHDRGTISPRRGDHNRHAIAATAGDGVIITPSPSITRRRG
jgi:PAS domain S-box-containing protein